MAKYATNFAAINTTIQSTVTKAVATAFCVTKSSAINEAFRSTIPWSIDTAFYFSQCTTLLQTNFTAVCAALHQTI